jgi:hypothetical protein
MRKGEFFTAKMLREKQNKMKIMLEKEEIKEIENKIKDIGPFEKIFRIDRKLENTTLIYLKVLGFEIEYSESENTTFISW